MSYAENQSSSGVGGGDMSTTGAKYFGTSLATSTVNPAIAAKNKLYIAAIAGVTIIAVIFLLKRRK